VKNVSSPRSVPASLGVERGPGAHMCYTLEMSFFGVHPGRTRWTKEVSNESTYESFGEGLGYSFLDYYGLRKDRDAERVASVVARAAATGEFGDTEKTFHDGVASDRLAAESIDPDATVAEKPWRRAGAGRKAPLASSVSKPGKGGKGGKVARAGSAVSKDAREGSGSGSGVRAATAESTPDQPSDGTSDGVPGAAARSTKSGVSPPRDDPGAAPRRAVGLEVSFAKGGVGNDARAIPFERAHRVSGTDRPRTAPSSRFAGGTPSLGVWNANGSGSRGGGIANLEISIEGPRADVSVAAAASPPRPGSGGGGSGGWGGGATELEKKTSAAAAVEKKKKKKTSSASEKKKKSSSSSSPDPAARRLSRLGKTSLGSFRVPSLGAFRDGSKRDGLSVSARWDSADSRPACGLVSDFARAGFESER